MRRSVSVLIAICVVLVAPLNLAHAEDDRAPDDYRSFDSVRRGAALGLSEKEASEKFDWTVDFNILATRLSERYPELYADARIIDNVTGAYLLFTTEVPDEARELVKGLPVAVELRTGARYNEKYLLGELMATYDRIWKTPGTLNVAGEMNVERNGLDFYVTPNAESIKASPEYLASAELYSGAKVPINITLKESFIPPTPQAFIRGGGYLNTSASAGDNPHCTAGFTVRSTIWRIWHVDGWSLRTKPRLPPL